MISPNQKLQRRVAMQLLLISAALFALNVVTGDKGRTWEDEANDALRMRREHNRAQEPQIPKTWAPGERSTIPLFEEAKEKSDLKVQEDVVVASDGTEPDVESPEPVVDVEKELELPEPLAGDALVEAIQTTVASEVRPEIQDCLHMWWMLDPKLSGRVVVGLQLGPEGLGASWIQDHTEVPLGPLTCFGSVLTEASWPWAAEETEVRFPFVFEGEEQDSGQLEEAG